jgi:excisionase family DNA binding protein
MPMQELVMPDYTVSEFAVRVNLSEPWVRQMIRESRIRAYKPTGPSGTWRIPRSELERLTGRTI